MKKLALKEISKRDYIIITNVDNGDPVVIMTVNDDVREAKHQINDSKNYKLFKKDPQQLIMTSSNKQFIDL